MATDYRRVLDFLRDTFGSRDPEQARRLDRRHEAPPLRVPGGGSVTLEAMTQRWALPGLPPSAREALADEWTVERRETYGRNIENFIGTAKVPVGLAGPLRVNGLHAQGDFYVPLATTEDAVDGFGAPSHHRRLPGARRPPSLRGGAPCQDPRAEHRRSSASAACLSSFRSSGETCVGVEKVHHSPSFRNRTAR